MLAFAEWLEEAVPVEVPGRAIFLVKLVEDFLLREHAIFVEDKLPGFSVEVARVGQGTKLASVDSAL